MSDPTFNGTSWDLTQVTDTVTAAEAPTNSDATDVPNNYLICDRTGFKIAVKPGLRQEWNGLMVRGKSWEARNAQDFVRSRSEDLNSSQRPEQSDTFLATNEVSTSDLQ